MYEYRHGGNVRFEPHGADYLDLSANINPLGMPPHVQDAIQHAVGECEFYPDSFSTQLREHIANHEQIKPEHVFCGNGSSDIIFRLPAAIRSQKVLTLSPTFADYRRAANAIGAEVVFHRLEEKNGFVCDETLLATVERVRPDLVFLCNPNNPTGLLTKLEVIEQLLQTCRKNNVFVVIDECFIDFTERAKQETAKQLLNEFDHLLVLKAFTKIFAMPGIRLGYALCGNKKLLDGLYAHGPDWPVSRLAQAAGIAATQNPMPYLERTIAFVKQERERMKRELEQWNYTIFDGQANFLLMKNPYPFDLQAELDAFKIKLRTYNATEGLDERFYRAAVSQREHNQRFIEAVQQITQIFSGGVK